MALEAFIVRYGVLAIFLGAGIEGEAVVVTGGVLVHRGLLPLVPTCIAAALGSCLVDQFWFMAGRRFRHHRWIARVAQTAAYRRAIAILERHQTAFILSFRFIYGLRTAGPVAIGTSQVPVRRFVILNIVAAAVWGPTFTLIGRQLGKAAAPLLARIAHFGVAAGIVAALIVALAVGIRVLRARRTPG